MFPDWLLYRLRNQIPIETLIAKHLQWPSKLREGRFVFVCPCCNESLSAINPNVNLARCFRCERNFNPIDFVMSATSSDFVEAVEYLISLLPPQTDALGRPEPAPVRH